jgi:hypothetical protein
MRLTVALVFAALLAPAPAGAQVPGGNLLANGDAEAVPGSSDGVSVVPPPGWTTDGPFTEVAYGAPEFLTTEDSASWGGGASFFAGGPDNAASSATQVVRVASAGGQIDGGGVSATLSALIGGYLSQTDAATVTATFLNAAGATVGTLGIGPVTPEDRQSATTLLSRSAIAAVPAGTRSIAVRIDATRSEGAFNDGYVDNISLTLGTGGGPVYHKTVVANPVSGKVLVKRPGSSRFVELDAAQGIPLGSTVDVRKGRIELTSVPKQGGTPETATFYDGIFKVTQPGSITELRLVEALACGRGAAHAAAKKPKTRKLWGNGSGSFRTRGQYSAATVRGTTWLVQDRCTSTLTKVTTGTVSVNDFVKHKTVLVRAGKSYTARRRGR